MYRKTLKYHQRVENQKRKHRASDPLDRPMDVPELRRILLVIDFDFGITSHVFKLYKTNRIDSYRVEVDDQPWKSSIGWARVLERVRKALPRVLSNRNL